MQITNIIGGLGNQMFQYAFALSLKEKMPEEEVLIDASHFHTIFFHHYKRGMNLHQGYELESTFPNLSLKQAKWHQLMRVTWFIPNYVLSRIARKYLPKLKSEFIEPSEKVYEFLPEVYNSSKNRYFEGYWQSVKYSEIVRQKLFYEFQHPEPDEYNHKMIEQIKASDSVGMHIRRGDYVSNKGFGGICDLDYYKRALKYIENKESKTFYIFSNDIQWCRENLQPLLGGAEVVYVIENKGKKSHWDMFLMTYCKSLIIANSSFSWWGAVLNHNVDVLVIAPSRWNNFLEKADIYRDSWIRV